MFASMNAGGGPEGATAVAVAAAAAAVQPDEEYSSSVRPRWKKPKRGVS